MRTHKEEAVLVFKSGATRFILEIVFRSCCEKNGGKVRRAALHTGVIYPHSLAAELSWQRALIGQVCD